MENRIGIVKAFREGTPYSYICEHYWEMSKDELTEVAKELCYELMTVSECSLDIVADELSDIWELE